MFKSIFTFLLLMLFVIVSTNALFAGDVKKDLKLQAIDKQIVTAEMEAEMEAKIRANADLLNYTMSKKQPVSLNKALATGDTIGWTVRDFTMNTCMGRKIAFDPATGNVHAIFTQWEPNATDPYHEYYNFYDAGFDLWFGTQSILPALDAFQTRSGRVMVGPNGEPWVSFHKNTAPQESFLAYDASAGGYSFTSNSIAAGNFASADYKDGGLTWFTTNDANADFEVDAFYHSIDGGVNWTQTTNFLTLPTGDAVANVELLPDFNPVNGDIEVMYANDNASDVGEAAWWATSSDLGDNWNITQIYEEETLLDSVWYLIENFSQYMTASDVNGDAHFVFNGYGFMTDGTSPDSTLYFIYPVVYWNSRDGEFVELTDDIIGRNEALSGELADLRSGNALGNAFPGIALGPNGVIAVIWEQDELAPGDTSLVRATNAAGVEDPLTSATDIWCAVSSDYGRTWSNSFWVAGVAAKCERSPSLAEVVEYDGSNYYIHFTYMFDPDPNQDLPNPPTDPAAWVYGKYDITSMLPPPNSVGGNDNVVSKFELSQNYPNPFNPTTEIKFNISKASDVTLEVFNIIGEKVATLVKGNKTAGFHTALFDGANHASGVYYYQLSAGDLVQTKKMLLVK